MIMDVAEATRTRLSPTARWGTPLVVSVETLVLLLVTVLVLQQLRFSSVIPRILLLLSSSLSLLLHKPTTQDGGFEEQLSRKEGSGVASAANERAQSLDHVSARRRIRSVNRSKIESILKLIPDEDLDGLIISENYKLSSRGVDIFTKSWIPKNSKPKASICYCHGYGDTCTYFFEGIARKLASRKYAVFAMDYAGFGLSGGLHGYIPDFDELVEDVTEHFTSIKEQEKFRGIPMFLMGESMGGAVALKAHLSMPAAWDGAILVAPMCKISEEMFPPRFVVEILRILAKLVPKAKLVPSASIADNGFRDLEKRQQAKLNMIAYAGKPRLGTALSLLKVTAEIEQNLNKVSLPLLILHGAADTITDPAISQALFEQARTVDKTYHLYENSWHAVLVGEPDETAATAINDIVKWLDARSVS